MLSLHAECVIAPGLGCCSSSHSCLAVALMCRDIFGIKTLPPMALQRCCSAGHTDVNWGVVGGGEGGGVENSCWEHEQADPSGNAASDTVLHVFFFLSG